MCIVVLSIIFILLLACPISLPKGRALIIEELRLVLLYLILIFLLSYILSFSWFPFFAVLPFFYGQAMQDRGKKKKKICPLTSIVLCVLFFFLFLRRERERERVRKCEKERERKRDTKRSVIEVISYYQYYRIIRLMLSLLFYY